ncbi:MAG TPA: SBBP repeat-containing protein [Flavobacteriales bacterium]|nr:SBBP repeat-containing protein [Flavobacteriales bacterium]
MRKVIYVKAWFLLVALINCMLPGFSSAQPVIQWAKKFGGTALDRTTSLALDASGNVYSTGFFSGTADFDPGTGIFNLVSAGSQDAYISKLDASGNFVWAKRIGSTSSDMGLSIAVDPSGNVYTSGYFIGTVDFDPGTGVTSLVSGGGADGFILKLDAAGSFVSVKRFTGTGNEYIYSIAADGSGNVYTTGIFDGTTDFDPGTGTFNLVSGGSQDIFICKLDASGNFAWVKQVGGAGLDHGWSIAVDASGNVYTTGIFSFTADFDPGTGVFNLTPSGTQDVFVCKLDGSGNFVWAKQLGGSASEYGYGIAVDASGNVYTAGYFEGTADFDPGTGTFNLVSAGLRDAFFCKLNSTGTFVTAGRMGGTLNDYAQSIALDASANIYIVADQYSANADYDPGPGAYTVINSGAEANVIAKYNSSGSFVCAFAVTPGHNEIQGNRHVAVTGTTVYITASFDLASTDFNPCTASVTSAVSGSTDIYVAKYDFATCNCTVLPVELVSFNAYRKNNTAMLEWETASEINNDYFIVERSADAVNYMPIGKIQGAGTSSMLHTYSLTDSKPYNGTNYYRLKQTDFDGTFAYSPVRVIDLNGIKPADEGTLYIHPNPASGYTTVEVLSSMKGEITLQVYDLTGEIVYAKPFPIEKGDNSLELDINFLSNGTYIMVGTAAGQEMKKNRLIINN